MVLRPSPCQRTTIAHPLLLLVCMMGMGTTGARTDLEGGGRILREPQRTQFHMYHIPKSAGTQFFFNFRRCIPKDANFTASENCLESDPVSGVKYIAMLRDPVSHVLSQFFHCTSSNPAMGRIHKAHQARVNMGTWEAELDDWLNRTIASGGVEKVLGGKVACYNPWNMMSKFLECTNRHDARLDAMVPPTHKPPFAPPDLGTNYTAILEALDNLFFYGFVEFYPESLARVCALANGKPYVKNSQRAATHTKGYNHNVTSHSRWNLKQHTLDMIRILVPADMDLYMEALRRWD